MKVIFMMLLIIFLWGCSDNDIDIIQPQKIVPDGYPRIWSSSSERVAEKLPRANQFASTFNVELAGFDSVRAIPLYNLGSGIDLFPNQTGTVSEEELQDSIMAFLARWGDLFNIHSFQVIYYSSVHYDTISVHYYYEKSVSGTRSLFAPLGRFRVHVLYNGIVKELSSTCVPDNYISGIPQVSMTYAYSVINNKQLKYCGWVGEQTLVVTPDKVSEAILDLISIERRDYMNNKLLSIEFHHCWRFKLPVFYVYVDAITGEDLNYAYQYMDF